MKCHVTNDRVGTCAAAENHISDMQTDLVIESGQKLELYDFEHL